MARITRSPAQASSAAAKIYKTAKDESSFSVALDRWITAGIPHDSPLYHSMVDKAKGMQDTHDAAGSPFASVLTRQWESATQFADAWHKILPWKAVSKLFMKSLPLTLTVWRLDEVSSDWTAAHFWRIVDVLESPAGTEVKQLFLPTNAFDVHSVDDSLRIALHELSLLARSRKIAIVWKNRNLIEADVRVRADELGASMVLLVAQGSTSFSVQGAIECATFAMNLRCRATLLRLDLTDCMLFDHGCAVIADALPPDLRHLNLTKNGLTCASATLLADKIVPALHSLCLSQNTVGPNGVLALSLAAGKAPELVAIDLTNNCITSGLVYMGRAMAKKGAVLRELRVCENGLTSQDGRLFAECLHTMPPEACVRIELSINALGRSCYDILAICAKKQFKGVIGLASNGIDEFDNTNDIRVQPRPRVTLWPWPPDECELTCWI